MNNVTVKIVKVEPGRAPAGKLADAELHFSGGELDGLKLVGFAVWTSRDGNGRNVTFPARQLAVGAERRNFTLLRYVGHASAQERLKQLILDAYQDE